MEANNNNSSSNQPTQKTAAEILKDLWSKKFFRICVIALAVLLTILIVAIIAVDASPKKSDYFIGDEISNSKSSFRVNSAYNTSQIGPFGTISNGSYFVISVSYTNNTDRSVTISEDDFILYNGSKKYHVNNETLLASNPLLIQEEVGAGICKTLTVVFETPTGKEDGNYVLAFSSPTGKFYVNIMDKESEDHNVVGYH